MFKERGPPRARRRVRDPGGDRGSDSGQDRPAAEATRRLPLGLAGTVPPPPGRSFRETSAPAAESTLHRNLKVQDRGTEDADELGRPWSRFGGGGGVSVPHLRRPAEARRTDLKQPLVPVRDAGQRLRSGRNRQPGRQGRPVRSTTDRTSPRSGGTRPAGYDDAAAFLKALGHPLRLRILCGLLREPRSLSGMVAALERPLSSVALHLAVLRNRGVLAEERRGSEILFRVRDERTRQVLALLCDDHDAHAWEWPNPAGAKRGGRTTTQKRASGLRARRSG